MGPRRIYVALFLFVVSAITESLTPPDITGLKGYSHGFAVDLPSSREYFLINLDAATSKIWCVAEGELNEVKWYFNENKRALSEEDGNYSFSKDTDGYVLEFKAIVPEVEGNYHCEAANSLGTVLSQYVKVSIADIGQYTKLNYNDDKKFPNEYLKLECKPPTSNPDLGIAWEKNKQLVTMDDRVQMDPDGNLYISNLMDSDLGIYKCFVKNYVLGETLYSEDIPIGFKENPTEVAERRPVLVYTPVATTIGMRNTTLQLQCIAEGNPTPEITWEKVDGVINSNQLTNSMLSLPNVDFDDAGTYICTASNSEGSTSAQTVVEIKAVPYAGIEMPNVEVVPGESTVFTCDAQGDPVPEFQWMINGKLPNDDYRYVLDSNTMTIADAELHLSAVFQCKMSNEYGTFIDQASYQVVVEEPEILTALQDLKVIEGQDASFTCLYSGKPAPNAIWEFKTEKIKTEGKYSIQEGSGSSVLVVSDVTIADDTGSYKCYVDNGFGNQESAANLIVLQKTVITQTPESKTAVAGDTVRFRCRASAYSNDELVITWVDDEGRLDTSEHYNLDGNDLVIREILLEHSANYTCIASTDMDRTNASASLTVQDRPGPLTTVDAILDPANSNKINIEWESGPEHNSEIISFIIEAKTAFDTTWSEVLIAESNMVSTKLDAHPGNTYTYRMAARNAIGQSDFVEATNTVTTPSGPPPVNPSNVAGKGVTIDTMTITWDIMEQAQHGGDGFKYVVKWRRSGEQEWQNATITDYKTTQYVVEGTTTYEAYDIQVLAVNNEGNAPEDLAIVVGHGGEDKPGAAPTNVVLTPSPRSIQVNWTAIPKDKENGEILNYQIFVKLGAKQVVNQKCPVGQNSCIVTNLLPNTKYEVSVRVQNSIGQGIPSVPVSTTTPEGAPSKVSRFQIRVLSDAMKLTWEDPTQTNGVLRGFTIKYGKINSEILGEETEKMVNADTYTYIVKNLNAGEKYSIKIWAFTNAEPGVVVKREETLKPNGVPNAVPKAFVDYTTKDNEAIISWSALEEGPAATEFVIHYKKNDGSDDDKTTTVSAFREPLSAILLVLERGTEYEVTIEAVNDDGNTFSDPIIIKTSGTGAVVDNGSVIQPWLIAMICIILLLVLIFLLLCFIRSQKGGKYNVSDKEDALRQHDLEAAPLKDQNGFNEYSPTEDSCEEKDPLKSLESAGNDDSDSDSLADYAEGDADQFNEDGSFINEYGDNLRRTNEKESSNAAYNTFV